MVPTMDVAIPPEFELYAREQVKVGAVASEEEAAAQALRRYAAHIAEVRALVDPAIAQADQGEGMDGDAFMRELIETIRAAHGG